MQICAPFLTRQIELKQPKLLLTAGKFATKRMLGTEDGIMRLRGRKLRYTAGGIARARSRASRCFTRPTCFAGRRTKSKAWDDLRTIAALCDQLGIKRGASL